MSMKDVTDGKAGSGKNKLISAVVMGIVLSGLVLFLIVKSQMEDYSFLGPQLANAESSSHGGEEKKAAEAEKEGGGHGEKKAENGHGEGGQGEAKKETVDPKVEAEKRKKAAAETRKELEGLEEKRLQIKKQEERLKEEQMKLKALKLELSDKIGELETMHRKIEESLQKIERKRSEKEVVSKEAQEKKIKQLVKMYSTMKPKQAGAIFNSMDIVIAEKIFMNMKGDAAGKILAYVESSKAALISERLAISVGRSEGRP
jgi:flagellar motility protein MotE (MotC chaperone)